MKIQALLSLLLLDVASRASAGQPGLLTLADEIATYTRWGWTWNPSQQSNQITDPRPPPYSVHSPSIHDDTGADDLWTYLMQYQRTGNSIFLTRANAWARYFRDDYRQCVYDVYQDSYCYDFSFLRDHMYGYGLVSMYEYTGDVNYLNAAVNLMTDVEAYWATRQDGHFPNDGWPMALYSMRQEARHLLLAVRVAEATGDPHWIQWRDKFL